EGYSMHHDNDPLIHGEAIAVGMICEAYISFKTNGLSEKELNEIVLIFGDNFAHYNLVADSYEELFTLMANDKKNEANKLGFALLNSIGGCDYNLFIGRDLIIESLDFYKSL